MWRNFLKILTFSIFFNGIFCMLRKNLAQIALEQEVVSIKNYVFYPNATVPFYVNSEHFDHEQSLAILTALSMFAFKSCLKFAPVMAQPQSNEHVMVFENPNGIRRCVVDTVGHSVYEPHRVVLGYDCLQSPNIDMMIMRSLGFPFEHNKPSRAVYIDVLHENIEPGHTDLFTMEAVQAMELSALPYDINSVMHFGDRDYSKNGHRTIMFKDPNMRQNKVGLTHMDLRKLDAVYGPECRTRDRQEKLDLCQSYPGVARRKREARPDEVEPAEATVKAITENDPQLDKGGKREGVEVSGNTESVKSGIENKGDKNVQIKDIDEEKKRGGSDKQDKNVNNGSEQKDIKIDVTKSLRINPNITPPPHVKLISLNTELGIADGLQDLVDKVFSISKLALNNAREKYCFNKTIGIKPNTRSTTETNATDTDILGIVDLVVQYVNGMVNHAKLNLTQFCQESESIDRYSRYGCHSGNDDRPCPQYYKSTKSGPVQYSTQHRPTYYASTKFQFHQKNIFDHHQGRRKKRSVEVEAVTVQLTKEDDKINNDDNNDVDKVKDGRNDDNVNSDVNKAHDDSNGNNATKISNKDDDEVVIERNKEIGVYIEKTGKRESNNETRGEKNDVEIKIENKNEAEDINQAEEMKYSKESKKFKEKLTMKVNHEPIRRRDRHYRRHHFDSSVSAERDRNLKIKDPSSEVDERQTDPRHYRADLELAARDEEKEQLKHRIELKRQRDEEYDKNFQKHLPEWSYELPKRDEYTTKRVSSTYTVRTTKTVKITPTFISDNERKIKRMRDKKGNERIAEEINLKWSKVKKLEPVEMNENEGENRKYSDTEDEKYEEDKDSDAEYEKYKEDDEKETEHKRPVKTKPKEKKYDEQSESAESDQGEKRKTSKKPRQMMTMKMKKESDESKSVEIKREKKTTEDNENQQSFEDEIANRQEKPSGEESKEISRMNLPRLVKLTKTNEEFYKDRRWPGGEVRYHIQEDTTYDTEDLRRRIDEVNDILIKKTCVYLKEITEDQATEYEDYLVIDNSPDYVTGRVGGRQKFGSIELFRGDQHRQHTAMMVMAWLGFYFEVSRHDRDKYVRVHSRHIRPDKLHHFEKIRDDATLNLPYDYESATHPAWQYWRQIGRKGISTVATYKHKDPEGTIMKSMGQNEKLLSDIDIVKINSVYGLSCKRHQRADENAKPKKNENAKPKRNENAKPENKLSENESDRKEHDTSSSDSSSSSTEDLSE